MYKEKIYKTCNGYLKEVDNIEIVKKIKEEQTCKRSKATLKDLNLLIECRKKWDYTDIYKTKFYNSINYTRYLETLEVVLKDYTLKEVEESKKIA